MNKQAIIDSVKKIRSISPKRNFDQTIDLIINLRDIDLKKPEQKIDFYLQIPYKTRDKKICALVDKELSISSKIFDKLILKEDFLKYTNNKKTQKKLANDYDIFVGQANIMTDIAASFGKVLGPKGKMPNPKAGCVILPTASIDGLKDKLQHLAHIQTKNETSIKVGVGNINMSDEEIYENINAIYSQLLHVLPQEKQNIKSVIIKFTMGPVVYITDKGPVVKENKSNKKNGAHIRK